MSKSKISNNSIKTKDFSSSTNKGNKITIKITKNEDNIEFFGNMNESKPPKNYYLKGMESELLKNNYLSNFIKLIFDIEHPIIKIVNFILTERKKENSESSDLSNFAYSSLVERNKILEEENNSYKAKYSNLESRVSKLEYLVKQLINRTKEIENKSGIESKDFSMGRIFNSKIDFDEGLVINWLDKKNFKAKLLFRMTEDGESFKTFHQKCDNKGSTMTIIETDNHMIFGGYTDLN